MLCPRCSKPYFFLETNINGKCKKCGHKASFSDIKHINFQKKNYLTKNKFYSRNLKTDPYLKWILKKMDVNKNDSILEIGCGVGDYCIELIKISSRVVGSDIFVNYAKNRFNDLEFRRI